MKKKKTILFLLIIFSIELLFSGCLDKKEVNELSIVRGLAIDTVDGLGNIQVSAIITNFSKTESDSSSSSPGLSQEIVTATGKTLLDAIDKLENISSKRIVISHSHVLIFGKDFALKGISDSIDTLERNPFFRNTVYVAIANGKAYDILKTNTKSDTKQASTIDELLRMFETKSTIYPTRFYTFLLGIKSYSEVGTVPIIKITENSKLLLEETAIFFREKMVETLNSNQTLYLQWLLNNIKDRLILIPFKEDNKIDNSISLYFFEGKTKIENKKTERGFNVTIKCAGTAELRGSTDSYFRADNPILIQQVKDTAESYLKKNTEELINFAQHSINRDFIGFGNNIYNNYPESLENLKWSEEFPKVTYTVEFSVHIKSVGIIKNTIER